MKKIVEGYLSTIFFLCYALGSVFIDGKIIYGNRAGE
jgi:hypothetical protein